MILNLKKKFEEESRHNNSEDSDSDSNEYVDHKRSSSLVNSDKEDASICQVTEQIKKLGLPNFSSETNAYNQTISGMIKTVQMLR